MTTTEAADFEAEHGALKASIRRAERAGRLRAVALTAPLVLFLLVIFVVPIAQMLSRSVHDATVADAMPRATEALAAWDGEDLPGEDVYAAIALDLKRGAEERTIAGPARRLNQDLTGFRSVVFQTANRLPDEQPEDGWKQAMIDLNEAWGERETLIVLKRASATMTPDYLLQSVDLKRPLDGGVTLRDDDQRIFISIIIRTLTIATSVTLICLLMGYPIAFLLANVKESTRNLLLVLVLLPFWTSLLVRTAAWIVVLQTEGLFNGLLQWVGLIDEPIRLIYNRIGVLIAMSQVLLPFMILPLFAVMRGIPASHMRAAESLGAAPSLAFRKVYLPQSMPGIGAGCLLVFMLSIGYYVTPALIGGSGDQMISYYIAFYANETVNWGLAAALGTVLMVIVLLLFAIYGRFFRSGGNSGGNGMKFG